MTIFDTPAPIHATIELAAEHTHVSYTGGHLVVTTPRHTSFATGGTVEVTVDLPAGSQLNASSEAGDLRGTGRFGDSTLRTAYGNIQLSVPDGTTARLDATTQYGTVRPPTPGGESIAVRAETGYGDIVVGHS